MAVLSVMRTSMFRAASRTTVQVARAPVFGRTFASISGAVEEKSINVVSYSKSGQREQETLAVSASTEPISPPGQDVEVAAQPLKHELLQALTPTMQKFTLFGQVAVITGWVLIASFFTSLLTNFQSQRRSWTRLQHGSGSL
jgi:hypothetical protein